MTCQHSPLDYYDEAPQPDFHFEEEDNGAYADPRFDDEGNDDGNNDQDEETDLDEDPLDPSLMLVQVHLSIES